MDDWCVEARNGIYSESVKNWRSDRRPGVTDWKLECSYRGFTLFFEVQLSVYDIKMSFFPSFLSIHSCCHRPELDPW